jgi:type II secretion system protein I
VNRSAYSAGFTLIEVMAALMILSMVLGGVISMVHQYADQRGRMSSKLFASQVAWNSLLEQYRYSEGWVARSERASRPRKGVEQQHGQDWRWQTEVKPAMGKDMYRYEARVSLDNDGRTVSALSLYIIED